MTRITNPIVHPMTSTSTRRVGTLATFLITGGAIALIAIVSQPAQTRAAGARTESTDRHRNLMIDQRPLLGELRGEGERTVIVGGEEGVSYLEDTGGRFYEETTGHDSLYAEPAKIMLVDLPEPFSGR